MIVFSKEWFEARQAKLLWLLNTPIVSAWFRWVLRIHGTRSEVNGRKITQILPNAIFWQTGEQITAEFRTHDKYSKRLYHAFKPVWWFIHFWDWMILDRWLPDFSFGFDSLTVYTAAGTSTQFDGWITVTQGSSDASSAWADAKAATNGTADQTSSTFTCEASVIDTGYAPAYEAYIARFYLTVDTSALGSGATLSSATWNLYLNSTYGSPQSAFYDGNVSTSVSTLLGSHLSSAGTTADTSVKTSHSTSTYNSWSLTSGGLSRVNKTGKRSYCFREAAFDVANVEPTADTTGNVIGGAQADFTGTSQDPYLSVTYTPGSTTYYKTPTGTITPSAALTKTGNKAFAGTLTPSGVVARVKQAVKTLAGTLTPSGALIKAGSRVFAGALTPSGVVARAKQAVKTLAGSLGPAGTVANVGLYARSLAGSLTPSGAVTQIKTAIRSMTGSIAPVGTIVRSTSKALSGSLIAVGILTKSIFKQWVGSITPGGALTAIKSGFIALVGNIGLAGNVVKSVAQNLAGSITPSGVMTQICSIFRTFSAIRN